MEDGGEIDWNNGQIYEALSDEEDETFDFGQMIECVDLDQVPIDAQSCLIMNQSYQKQLEYFIACLNERLEQNLEQQTILNKQLTEHPCSAIAGVYPLNAATTSTTMAISSHNRTVFSFKCPYFKDVKGHVPPINEDTLKKQQNGELNQCYTLPTKPWTKKEKIRLQRLVRQYKDKEAIEKMRNDKEMLLALMNDLPEEEKLQLSEQINQIDQKIEQTLNEPIDILASQSFKIDWLYVAKSMDYDALNCELYWNNSLHPAVNKHDWTPAEMERIECLVKQSSDFPPDWDEICRQLNTGRKAWQVCRQYQINFNIDIRRDGKFTEQEERLLEMVIKSCSFGDHIPWYQVKNFFDGRNVRQLKRCWQSLTRKQGRCFWSVLEDYVMFVAIRKFGTNWKQVCPYLPGRSANDCRDRYHSIKGKKRAHESNTELKSREDANRLSRSATQSMSDSFVPVKRKRTRAELRWNFLEKRCKRFKVDTFLRKGKIELLKRRLKGQTANNKQHKCQASLIRTLQRVNRGSVKESNEWLDDQILELFSNYDLLTNTCSQKPYDRSSDTVCLEDCVLNYLKQQMNAPHRSHECLADSVYEYAFNHAISAKSSPDSSLPPLMPINRSTLTGFFGLLLVKDSIAQNVINKQSELDMVAMNDLKNDPNFKLLNDRLVSLFYWPALLTDVQLPPNTSLPDADVIQVNDNLVFSSSILQTKDKPNKVRRQLAKQRRQQKMEIATKTRILQQHLLKLEQEN